MNSIAETAREYQRCTRCVMDTSARDIAFDENGVCNYCTEFLHRSSSILFPDKAAREQALNSLVEGVKRGGKGRKYDCVVGVSGGVDSSYALYKAVQLGLRPLAVHMDNGWNSELAQHNIQNLIQKLNVDLFTHVINWEEYRALQQSFFDSDVIDIELLYDNALKGPIYNRAVKYKIKYILGGQNYSTEGMRMPPNWSWYKKDVKNIKDIYIKHGSGKRIRTFPFFSTFESNYYKYIRRIEWISFIDYFKYNKQSVIEKLQQRVDFRPYPYKHYESVFTRFYQGYILPKKFGVDKRKVHLSTLVITGQMKRKDALNLLAQSPYPDFNELKEDIEYFLKKMGWLETELNDYLARMPGSHLNYKSELYYDKWLKNIKSWLFNR